MITYKFVRTEIDIEHGNDWHERVKQYARDNGIRHPRAYAELIEKGIDASDNSN